MVTAAVAEPAQDPVIVYITVYVPSELELKLIVPVVELITNPEGDEVNIPPEAPVIPGAGSVPD